jgi:hypothetical protein
MESDRPFIRAYIRIYIYFFCFLHKYFKIIVQYYFISRSQWTRGLRRSAAAWLLGSRVRIPLGAWMFVSCDYMLCCPV